jgi:hypothetical protein
LNALEDIAAEDFYGLFPIIVEVGAENTQNGATKVLIDEIANLVKMGLAADKTNAQMFLKMHQPQAAQTSADSAQLNVPAPFPQSIAHDATKDGEASNEVYRMAHETLRSSVTRLAPLIAAQEDAEFSEILEVCVDTSSEIADIFSESRITNTGFCVIKDEILSAADKILFMSLEGGLAPAIAATTAILQIQREFEVQTAN